MIEATWPRLRREIVKSVLGGFFIDPLRNRKGNGGVCPQDGRDRQPVSLIILVILHDRFDNEFGQLRACKSSEGGDPAFAGPRDVSHALRLVADRTRAKGHNVSDSVTRCAFANDYLRADA